MLATMGSFGGEKSEISCHAGHGHSTGQTEQQSTKKKKSAQGK